MASERKRQVVDIIESSPASSDYIASMLGIKQNTARTYIRDLRDDGFDIESTDDGYILQSCPVEYDSDDSDAADADDSDADPDDSGDGLIDLSDVAVDPDADPDPSNLTDREELIAGELQSGATVDDLADELDERQSVITQHIRDLKSQGWQIYVDETAEHIAIEGDEPLRSSEHKGTRTRKANQWWETRHNAVVRRWKALDTVSVDPDSEPDSEDWNTHITDLHAGDRVRGYDDETIIHRTEELPAIINHITERSIALARKHNSRYDCANLLYGGDFVTSKRYTKASSKTSTSGSIRRSTSYMTH
jgi:biotin operon repressor